MQTTEVTLTESEFAGSYVVTERRADGTLVLRPTTSDASPEARRRAAETETRRIVERHSETFDELAK